MSQVIVSNKNIRKNFRKCKVNCGDFISKDRFYTIINQFIDDNLYKYSKLICFCVVYLFRSSNYQHMNLRIKKIVIFIRLIDFVCWICTAVAVILTFIGPAASIINEIKRLNFHNLFNFSSDVTLIFVVEIVCLLVAFSYVFILRRKILLNRKMSLPDYVNAKIGLIVNFDFCFKIRNKLHKTIKKKMVDKQTKTLLKNVLFCDSNHLYIVTGLESINLLSEVWLIMQLINVMYYLFSDFNFALIFNDISETQWKIMKKFTKHDFPQIRIELSKIKKIAI